MAAWLRFGRGARRSAGEPPAAARAASSEAALIAAEADLTRCEALLATDPVAALAAGERALAALPDSPRALRAAAAAARAAGDAESALDHYTLLAHLDPQDAQCAIDMAGLLRARGEAVRARRILQAGLERQPAHPGLNYELAQVLYAASDHDAAVSALRAALGSEPAHAGALNLLGLILARERGELAEGEQLVARALQGVPGWTAAQSNLGWILAEQGRNDEALRLFDALLARDPDDAQTRLMRACALLKQGEFRRGWRDYAVRHQAHAQAVHTRAGEAVDAATEGSEAPWLESPADARDRRVRVLAEQGLGDQIMFASCLPDLAAAGAQCTVECDARLKSLFERSFPGLSFTSELAAPGAFAAGEHDLRVWAGTLPAFFRNDWSDFPPHAGYLRADQAAVSAWRTRLAQLGSRPKIGLSWRGGMVTTRRQLRSLALSDLVRALGDCGEFVSLQYGDCSDELREHARSGLPAVHHWAEELQDYDNTAALVTALDGVVSVCTAVAHLSGALGRPLWVLTPTVPEWRYLAQGDRWPWYPSARLMRQVEGEPLLAVAARCRIDMRGSHLGF
jgi:tetratricopeptide (TPR) repeat protein